MNVYVLYICVSCRMHYAGSYSNWRRHEPYNHNENIKCAAMDTTQGQDQVQWMDYACSAQFGALCDLGPGNNILTATTTTIITRMEGRAQREATRSRRGRGGDGREGERRGVEAVSYTHLTLPTILRV